MATSQKLEWMEVQGVLRGQDTVQVRVDKYEVNIGAVQGGVVNVAKPKGRAADRIRPRREPPYILPRAVPGFLDRSREQGLVTVALARRQVVDIHGPNGAGKTALTSQAMQCQLPSAFPDGMVYLSARHETREDLLQDVFHSFFESDGLVKVTENDLRRHMAGKQALLAVDDANLLQEGEAEDLAQSMPQCALLVAAREQQIWQGTSISLNGLPKRYGAQLFEQHWGKLQAEDLPTVEAICEALHNVPLAIVKTAAMAEQQHLSLEQTLEEVQPDDKGDEAVVPVLALMAKQLSTEERLVLGGLAASGGRMVGVEALPAITGLGMGEIRRQLARLQEAGLVLANDSRYGLDDGLRPYIEQAWTRGEMRAKAAEYYLGKASALHQLPKDPEEENVLSALDHWFQHGQWHQVVTMVRALDRYLASTGRWGQWRKRLEQALQAARKLGDRSTEAWAQHQLGVLAIGVGEMVTARQMFRSALSLRRALSDRPGALVSRWNLQLLAPPPPAPWNKLVHKIASIFKAGSLWLPMTLATVALLGTLTVIAATNPGAVPEPAPPAPTLAASLPPSPVISPVTATHTPRAEVPASVDVWLASGCDGIVAPGTPLSIQARSSITGRVAIYLVDPDGEQSIVSETDVQAQEVMSQTWSSPEQTGNWAVEANLNHGQAFDRCNFVVETPAEPQVGIWLAEGCGHQYRTGAATQISLWASAGGRVTIWLDGQTRLFERDLPAGEIQSEPWNVGTTPGQHRLSAILEDGRASSECSYEVQSPPAPTVEVWLAEGCGKQYRPGSRTQISFRSSVAGQVAVYLVSGGRAQRLLFSEWVQAGRLGSRAWRVPEATGNWSLMAVLNGGQARDTCGLVVIPEPPRVRIWLKEGCGHVFTPGSSAPVQATVLLQASVDGLVEVYEVGPQGEPEFSFSEWLTAGVAIEHPWNVPGLAGDWALEAVLNDGRARDRCEFTVLDVPVTIDIELTGGCNQTYEPGSTTGIRLQASEAGTVTVSLYDPAGVLYQQWSRQVTAGQAVNRIWRVPRGTGEWLLVAVLDGDRARDECHFTVREPTPAAVEITLSEGCGRAYEENAATQIQLLATVNGTVTVSLSTTEGSYGPLYTEHVQAGQPAYRDWTIPGGLGLWTLKADLNGGQAQDVCSFQAQPAPEPEVWLTTDRGCGEAVYETGSVAQVSFGASVEGRLTVRWSGQESPVFSGSVGGGDMYQEYIEVGEVPGSQTLSAVLGGTKVYVVCSFVVEEMPVKPAQELTVMPGPTITATTPIPTLTVVTPAELTPTAFPAELTPSAEITPTPAPTPEAAEPTPTVVWTPTPVPPTPGATPTPG
jgi:hypothetical protein